MRSIEQGNGKRYKAPASAGAGRGTRVRKAPSTSKASAPKAPGGDPFGDIGRALDGIFASRGKSDIVPRTMKGLPKGGVRGVVKRK